MNAKPLLSLVNAERRIKAIEPRDFRAQPWIMGEGVTFWTPARISILSSENETRRKLKALRK